MEGSGTRQAEPEEFDRLADLLRPYQIRKLEENAHKGHWENESPYWLLKRARQELDEVETALMHGNSEEVAEECADAGNFLAMIVDVLKRRR